MPIQQKLTPPVLLFSDFAGRDFFHCKMNPFNPLTDQCVIFYTYVHYVRKRNHKFFKLKNDKGRLRAVFFDKGKGHFHFGLESILGS